MGEEIRRLQRTLAEATTLIDALVQRGLQVEVIVDQDERVGPHHHAVTKLTAVVRQVL